MTIAADPISIGTPVSEDIAPDRLWRRILASREALYARADAVIDTASRTVRQSLKDLERAVPAAKETQR